MKYSTLTGMGFSLFLGLAATSRTTMAKMNPVTMRVALGQDIYHRSDMPKIPARSAQEFAPAALRFGTGEKDIAFFLFDARRKGDTLPDMVYLWIPGHAEYNEPKPFRGKIRKEDGWMGFRDLSFSSEDAGVQRQFTISIIKSSGEAGNLALEVTQTAEYQGKRTVITYGQKPTSMTVPQVATQIRVQTLFEEPLLQLRAAGNGTEVSCSLSMGKEWYLLPREGMDTAITVDVTDSAEKPFAALRIAGDPESYIAQDAWKLRLPKLKKGEKYRVRARMDLGPWLGELKETVWTQWVDRGI